MPVRNKTAANLKKQPTHAAGTLKELPNNTYFRTIDSRSKVSRETCIKRKGNYDSAIRKYSVSKTSDVWGSGKEIKGS